MIWRLVQLLLWPALFVYFRVIGNKRTRVLITCQQEVLLIRDAWPLVSDPAAWSLPGGGIKQGEAAAAAAIRELREELGLETGEDMLLSLGTQRTTERGIGYEAAFFQLELPARPELKLQAREVKAGKWFEAAALDAEKLSPAVREALALLNSPQ